MAGGKLLKGLERTEEAEEWFKAAERHMRIVLKVGTGRSTRLVDFSNANLGNLFRLRGDYQQAVDYYMRALDYAPETSMYTNGLNELSLVYFEIGDFFNALRVHELALRTTQDRNYHLKLMGQVIDIINESGYSVGSSIQSVYNDVSVTANDLYITQWLTRIRALLSISSC